ncbi:alpha/beta fold hydrolase [Buchnera aphidicola]|uniref:alpha/beta fold hydrolase n=1 Tax=Buchnera aphidicola TaxID=9 RepID=UPI003BEF0037
MKIFHWNIIGNGKINLVFLHGWGIDSRIWNCIIKELDIHFKLYIIDLPGFGKNLHLKSMSLNEIIYLLHFYLPKNAIWLGWSIGGLIVNQLALKYPNYILAIITISSSPCFLKKKIGLELKKKYYKIFIII